MHHLTITGGLIVIQKLTGHQVEKETKILLLPGSHCGLRDESATCSPGQVKSYFQIHGLRECSNSLYSNNGPVEFSLQTYCQN